MNIFDQRRSMKIIELANEINHQHQRELPTSTTEMQAAAFVLVYQLASALVRLEDAEARIANLEAGGAKTLVVVSKLLGRVGALEGTTDGQGDDEGERGEAEEVEDKSK